VNCPKSYDLHPYFDDELDDARRQAFAAHLADCPECSGELEMQKALRANLQDESFRYKAPAGLGRRLQSALCAAAPSPLPRY
jgi:anti-sigma factor RsiW